MPQDSQNPRASIWLTASMFTAFAAFAISTQSPFALVLPVLYVLPLVLSGRMERDSANIWGLRLLIYALFAVLGRTPTGMPNYFYDARAFTTAGLIIGGEILLQSFRVPPRGYRFDPILIFLSGIIFLIACNTQWPHIWILAPVYVLFTLLALGDLRPRTDKIRFGAWATRFGAIAVAVGLGAFVHFEIWVYRANISALGARLLSPASFSSGGAQIGENPELQSSFNQGASTSRMLKIEGTLSSPNLRSAAFDEYREGAWGPKLSERTIEPALPDFTRENDPKDEAQLRTDTDAQITVLRPTGDYVFAPLNAYALVPKDGTSFDWNREIGPLKITEEQPPFRYGVVDSKKFIEGIPVTQGPLTVAPDAQDREKLLEIPDSIDPEVINLALEATQNAPTNAQKAVAIVEYLFENHKYSLEFNREPNVDPVSDFLLNKKSAHCQYFASAAVMMLRANGIPARYASGFYAHEAASDGSTIVRVRDAHAWAEAYIDGVGWVSVEATPPAGRADPNVAPLPFYQKWLEWAQDTFTRVRAWFSSLTQLQIAGMVAVALLIWGAERLRQSWKKRRAPSHLPTIPEQLKPLARDFERVLAARGITLAQGQTWRDAVPQEWENERRWIENYNRLRFQSEEFDKNEIDRLKRELGELKRSTR